MQAPYTMSEKTVNQATRDIEATTETITIQIKDNLQTKMIIKNGIDTQIETIIIKITQGEEIHYSKQIMTNNQEMATTIGMGKGSFESFRSFQEFSGGLGV